MEHIGTLPTRRIHRNSQEFEFGSQWWRRSSLIKRKTERREREPELLTWGGKGWALGWGRRRAAAGEKDCRIGVRSPESRETESREETESLWLGFGLEAIF
jgi:hypothetical protein